MKRFGKRTARFMAMLWIGTIVAELVLLELARRTDNSWILLLALALLAVPIAAMDWTLRWFSRPARKRWKRHDVEDALAQLRGAGAGVRAAQVGVALRGGVLEVRARPGPRQDGVERGAHTVEVEQLGGGQPAGEADDLRPRGQGQQVAHG